jgi:enoyl-CoA hydratase/carnithine racemase
MPEVEYELHNGIARLTINRPERRNAMSFEVMRSLSDSLRRIAEDETARVVVLTGAGEKAFSAGADLVSMSAEAPVVEAHKARGLLADVFRGLWRLEQPTIARVRGFALAGGFGLAMACDFVFASSDAQFGTPEIDVGLWPYMITVPLLRSMPQRVALELMATGRRVDATEAARIGFVNRVVAPDELDQTVDEFASGLAAKSPLILGMGKRSFYRALEMQPDAALDYLQTMLTITSSSEDSAEGIAAFVEKRSPQWRGR